MSSTTNTSQQSKPLELELTILSAKHLHNVNWRNGDIKPYVVFWLDSDRRLSTKPDKSGSTKPVWNETFTLPIASPAVLSLEILHSKSSETPNPLIGSVRIDLRDLKDPADGTLVRKFELRRPSGRPQGKISVKLAISERVIPNYAPPNPNPIPYYYSTAPPPPSRDYRQYPPSPYTSPFPPPPSRSPSPAPTPYYGSYPESYPGYFSGYYQQPPLPPPPARPYFDRPSSYGGPSAPVDYAVYDQKQRSSGELGVGSVAGAMGGLTLDEGVKYEEDKFSVGRGESDLASKDGYRHYHTTEY